MAPDSKVGPGNKVWPGNKVETLLSIYIYICIGIYIQHIYIAYCPLPVVYSIAFRPSLIAYCLLPIDLGRSTSAWKQLQALQCFGSRRSCAGKSLALLLHPVACKSAARDLPAQLTLDPKHCLHHRGIGRAV